MCSFVIDVANFLTLYAMDHVTHLLIVPRLTACQGIEKKRNCNFLFLVAQKTTLVGKSWELLAVLLKQVSFRRLGETWPWDL